MSGGSTQIVHPLRNCSKWAKGNDLSGEATGQQHNGQFWADDGNQLQDDHRVTCDHRESHLRQ